MDLYERIFEMSRQGYYCSQILMKLMLETCGEENPALVKALMGLCGGVGFSGGCCGCMTAGTCMISYLTGKGSDQEPEASEHRQALKEFTEWFKERMVPEFGSTNCCDVIGFDPKKRIEMCPPIIADTYEKCIEILEETGLL